MRKWVKHFFNFSLTALQTKHSFFDGVHDQCVTDWKLSKFGLRVKSAVEILASTLLKVKYHIRISPFLDNNKLIININIKRIFLYATKMVKNNNPKNKRDCMQGLNR